MDFCSGLFCSGLFCFGFSRCFGLGFRGFSEAAGSFFGDENLRKQPRYDLVDFKGSLRRQERKGLKVEPLT